MTEFMHSTSGALMTWPLRPARWQPPCCERGWPTPRHLLPLPRPLPSRTSPRPTRPAMALAYFEDAKQVDAEEVPDLQGRTAVRQLPAADGQRRRCLAPLQPVPRQAGARQGLVQGLRQEALPRAGALCRPAPRCVPPAAATAWPKPCRGQKDSANAMSGSRGCRSACAAGSGASQWMRVSERARKAASRCSASRSGNAAAPRTGNVRGGVQVVIQRIQRCEVAHQRRGRFRPHSRHTGNVVDAVARQCQIVGHAFGSHAEALGDFLVAIFGRLAVIPEDIARPDQLRQVLVARHHGDAQAVARAPAGQRADQIVRFVFGAARYSATPRWRQNSRHSANWRFSSGGAGSRLAL